MNLVFASGFLVPQQLLGINYFRNVRAHLEGAHLLAFPPVSPFGTVAWQLLRLDPISIIERRD